MAERRFGDWPLALKSILGFWLAYALTVVIRATLGDDPLTTLQNKLLNILIGILLTGLVYAAITLFGRNGPGIRRKAIAAGLGSLVAAFAMAILLVFAEQHMRESREEFRYQAGEGVVVVQKGHQVRVERRASEPLVLNLPRVQELDRNLRLRMVADAAVVWLFFFVAWSAFYLAVLAQRQALQAHRAASLAESAAQAAQVRALRYQINPHFLFNTLTSISSLIRSQPDTARTLIIKLSALLRRLLRSHQQFVTLREELEVSRGAIGLAGMSAVGTAASFADPQAGAGPVEGGGPGLLPGVPRRLPRPAHGGRGPGARSSASPARAA